MEKLIASCTWHGQEYKLWRIAPGQYGLSWEGGTFEHGNTMVELLDTIRTELAHEIHDGLMADMERRCTDG